MAIVVTSLGVASDKASSDPWVAFSDITLATGDALILILAADIFVLSAGLTWNSVGFDTTDVAVQNTGNVRVQIMSWYSVTGGTGDVSIPYFGDTPVAMTAALYKVTGLDSSSPVDKASSSTGSGTSASSGATAELSQADELIIGAIGVEDEIDDQTGSWVTGAGNVSGNEQQIGTNGAGDASNISLYSAAEVVAGWRLI